VTLIADSLPQIDFGQPTSRTGAIDLAARLVT
jgi:hypothetical protein